MTNNPTIDGVSREFACRALSAIQRLSANITVSGKDLKEGSGTAEELRALLDADHIVESGKMVEPVVERDATQAELAALQSTIAQLQARIAALESGMGEPAAWETLGVNEYGLQCRKAVTEIKPEIESVWLLWGDRFTVTQRPLFTAPPAPVAHTMKSVMSAVCTITGFPMLTSNQCHALAQSLNTCLDATAALNGERG